MINGGSRLRWRVRRAAVGLDLFRLLVFVTVVERAGYSAAAKHLHLSQATVSFHVQALERLFDTKLLVYQGRAVHLTPAGEEVFHAARLMLREGERLTESVRDVRLGHRGRLAVGASIAFETAVLLPSGGRPILSQPPPNPVDPAFRS
jgi:DNA-binding transcriptional LysR family regulator